MNNKTNYLMAKYQELINQLRMCRSNLDENIIVAETQKIASSNIYTIHDVLRNCIELAMEGNPMPWETDNQSPEPTAVRLNRFYLYQLILILIFNLNLKKR